MKYYLFLVIRKVIRLYFFEIGVMILEGFKL